MNIETIKRENKRLNQERKKCTTNANRVAKKSNKYGICPSWRLLGKFLMWDRKAAKISEGITANTVIIHYLHKTNPL